MGLRASVILISPEAYAAMVKDPQTDDVSLSGKCFEIDKAWSEFHQVFKQMGEPLKFAIEGKFCPYGNFETGEVDGGVGFVSAALAARIAKALAKLPFKTISDAVRESWRNHGHEYSDERDEYLGYHYETLQKAYATAAQRKKAVFISIC
jgi:hypothetical protein